MTEQQTPAESLAFARVEHQLDEHRITATLGKPATCSCGQWTLEPDALPGQRYARFRRHIAAAIVGDLDAVDLLRDRPIEL